MFRWIAGLCVVLIVAGVAWYAMTDSGASKTKKVARTSSGSVVSAGGVKKGTKAPSSVSGSAGRIETPRLSAAPSSGKRRDFGFSPQDQFEEGEILVSNPPARFETAAAQLGFSVAEKVDLPELSMSLYRLNTPSGMGVKEARTLLRGKFPGLTIDANHQFEAQGPKDFPRSLPRAVIGWRKATADCGSGIRIGMIDASIDVSHAALKGQKLEFVSFHKKGRKPGPADHGTAVAGIFIGKPSWGGLLPGASLFAGNMFEINESGRVVGNGVGLLKAINWLAQKKVHVVNMSVAGGDNKLVRKALKTGMKKGIVIVAAAGNWGKKGNKPAYPAAYKEVMAVTAFGADKRIYSHANTGKYVDFAAPGVQIYTAIPGGGRMQSGTSFASPYISVLVALENARLGNKSAIAIRDLMMKKTIDLGKKGRDQVFGNGFIKNQPKCK